MTLLDDLIHVADRLGEGLRSVARAAAEWVESEEGQNLLAFGDYCAVTTRVSEFYAHTGWYLPVHPGLHRYALEHLEFHKPFDPRDAASLVGPGSPHWRWVIDGVLASPSVDSRRDQLQEAVRCIELDLWHAAVVTLLPIIEGIASDQSGVLDGIRVGRRIDRILHSESAALEASSAATALDVIDAEVFKRVPFEAADPNLPSLNRHLVLHGRPVAFGTGVNAIRALMLLSALVEIIDGPIVLRTRLAPVDQGSLLDDYGPLASLRGVANRGADQSLQASPSTATAGG